jgi:starch phosphorylase
LIFSDYFSPSSLEFSLPCAILFCQGDFYMHLADLNSYLDADKRLCGLYVDPDAWARKFILSVGRRSNRFSGTSARQA